MELLNILLSSIGSVIVLFILTKLIGNKQMSQLSLFDYINGITIGSIAAEMATSLEDDFLKPLIAMIVYSGLSISISLISNKSIKARKFLEGESLILFENGKLYKDNLKKSKLDISEFLIQCRNQGYFDLNNIDTALIEPNGKISFLPKTSNRPVNTSDMKLNIPQETLVTNVIMDGKIMRENIKYIGKNEEWLNKELKKQKISKPEEVFLATCDSSNILRIYKKIREEKEHGTFK